MGCMKCGVRPRIAVSLFLALLTPPGRADPAPVIHYAPAENLEHVDVALIDRAEHEIDMAAYVLTDWPILQARPFDREALWAQTQRADRMKKACYFVPSKLANGSSTGLKAALARSE
jgi:hypothetical protein